FAVPRHAFGFYVAWIAMLAITFAVLPSGPDHSSPFSGIDTLVNLILAISIAAIIVIRGLIIALRARPSDAPTTPAPILWAMTGAVAAFCGIITISLLYSAAGRSWIAHLPALLIAAGAAALFPACRRFANDQLRALAMGIAGSAIVTFAFAGTWI